MQFVDLFCGAGGFTTGLRAAGLRHAVGVELDPTFAATYAANHGAVLVRDVAGVTAADITPFLHGRPLDVLAASPPCQSVSLFVRGRRRRLHLEAGGDDPRDALYTHVVRLARSLQPRFVLVENVVGMQSQAGPSGRPVSVELMDALALAGYAAAIHRVEAEAYGVPQRRRRLIIVAARRPEAPPALLPHPALPPAAVAAGRCLLPPSRVPPAFFVPRGSPKEAYFRARLAEGKFVSLVDRAEPLPTAIASYSVRNARFLVQERGGRLRALMPLEYARLQSFPDDYTWRGTQDQVYRQIGNAVPPLLAEHVGRSLLAGAQADGRGDSGGSATTKARATTTRRRRRQPPG